MASSDINEILDNSGNLHVGPFSRSSAARITVDFDPGYTDGIALDVNPVVVGASRRAGIKIGDFSLVQDSAKSGVKDIAIIDSNGVKVAGLVNAVGQPGTQVDLYQSTIPLIFPPTYNMGNNGAITVMNTLPYTYPACFIWIPINGITASLPAAAGWYYAEMSSTTAGTLYNNTWDGVSQPVLPTTKVAFVTTGPGAVTGPTTEVAVAAFPMAATLASVNGAVRSEYQTSQTNNANVKTLKQRFTNLAGTTLHTATLTSFAENSADFDFMFYGVSAGAAVKQRVAGLVVGSTAFVRSTTAQAAEATSAAWSMAVTLAKATATDAIVVEFLRIFQE